MVDAIKALLNEYLSEIFNVLTVVLVAVINLRLGFYLKSKIEDVRSMHSKELTSFSSQLNLLNRKSEIKFQKYQLEQAEAIKNLYSLLIDIEFSTNALFNASSYKNPQSDFKNRLIDWVNNYWAFYTFYRKNRILLNKNLISLIENDLKSLNQIHSIIFKKAKDVEESEKSYLERLDFGDDEQNENYINIKEELKRLRVETENKESEFKFPKLLSKLEKEYISLLQ